MAKRQERIYKPYEKEVKDKLINSEATLCLKNNSLFFCTIISINDDFILVKDKLLQKHTFLFQEVTEIILEREGTL